MLEFGHQYVRICHPLCEDVDWNRRRAVVWACACASSSMRGCGLKLFPSYRIGYPAGVILYARMWIEIGTARRCNTRRTVILYARMWIEIKATHYQKAYYTSHPLCEDVDWNIRRSRKTLAWLRSSSVRGCGLKSAVCREACRFYQSSSVRGCGLKLVLVHVPVIYHQVSLCVRMWIEISVSVISSALFDVILYARVWIEIFRGGLTKTLATRHLPCEGEGALLIIFASKAYEKTSVWVYSIIMLYTAGIS